MNQSQGHETTALTMSAVLLLLAMHPEMPMYNARAPSVAAWSALA